MATIWGFREGFQEEVAFELDVEGLAEQKHAKITELVDTTEAKVLGQRVWTSGRAGQSLIWGVCAFSRGMRAGRGG